jgi:hypothetical protein
MRRKTLISILLVVIAVLAGAFALQYYIWRIPYEVKPLTNSITVATLGPLSGATTGSYTYGTAPTSTAAAVPAKDATTPTKTATIILQKAATVYFRITDSDASSLASHFYSLKITINLYESGVAGATAAATITLTPVSAGVAQTNVVGSTTALVTAKAYDAVITVDYTTADVSADSTGNIDIQIYAVEA